MVTITPFQINIPDASLSKLKQKLQLTSFPEGELEEAGWAYGVPLQEIKDLTKYWIEQFDWRATEKKLNRIPQFTTDIKKSNVKGAIPLLFLHGWPGSFLEAKKILPLLRGEDGKQAFHVVAPSLPNFGFSGRVTKKGFGLGKYAETANNLMLALGYNQYVVQGGDWGSIICRVISARFPQHCKAAHQNMSMGAEPNPKPKYTDSEISFLQARNEWLQHGSAYNAIQSTKPSTLAISLADSPSGLLAWIYEKLVEWTDNYPWTADEVLTWISIYYFSTAGAAASIYIYYEATHDAKYNYASIEEYASVPLAFAVFLKEHGNVPKSWRATLGPVVEDVSFDKGGHFAAWECPEELAGCLVRVFGNGGGAEGVVKNL